MRKIVRHKINDEGNTLLDMPFNARLIGVEYLGADAYIFAVVNPKNHHCIRQIRGVVNTNEEVTMATSLAPVVGTIVLQNARASRVAHIFDMGEKNK